MRRSLTVAVAVRAAVVALLVLAVTGCSTSYQERTQFLDRMNADGIEYRKALQRQNTAPSEAACEIGWGLLGADIPSDGDKMAAPSGKWKEQVKEAYMKGCLTGQERPKPEPSGVKAVTPVPIGSEGPRVPGGIGTPAPVTSAPSPTASAP